MKASPKAQAAPEKSSGAGKLLGGMSMGSSKSFKSSFGSLGKAMGGLMAAGNSAESSEASSGGVASSSFSSSSSSSAAAAEKEKQFQEKLEAAEALLEEKQSTMDRLTAKTKEFAQVQIFYLRAALFFLPTRTSACITTTASHCAH
jgi:hypothetical protein